MKTNNFKLISPILSSLVNNKVSLIAICIGLLCITSGCLTPKKMDKWIGEYAGDVSTKIKYNDYINIKTSVAPQGKKASSSKKGKGKLVPALLYWKTEASIITSLNPFIPVKNLSTTIIQYANTKGLRNKLNGQKIELSIDKEPTAFTLVDNFQLVILIVYYIHWEKIFITPHSQDLVISYRVLQDNAEVKKGVITVTDPSKPISQKFFQSIKKMTYNYLDEYDNSIKSMSKEFVDKLLLVL